MRKENNHRKARIGFATVADYESIKEYRRRRAERLAERGIKLNEYRKSKDEVKLEKKKRLEKLTHLDAEGDEEQQNNKKSGGGGHGNTRLPFGLCERFGIAIGEGWTPKDAWDALAGKGISADGAYARLKRGEDPGTPAEGGDEGTTPTAEEEPEPPKEPVKSVKLAYYGGAEYSSLRGSYLRWAGRGDDKWRLYGDMIPGTGEEGKYKPERMSKLFHTKSDMYSWLKKEGIEEFEDPETGELVNPQEMELPREIFRIGTAGYIATTIGLRDGLYTIIGTDYDGKKKTLDSFTSLEEAKQRLTERLGVSESDIRLSPALKKREAERVEWLTSDKKGWIERSGIKFGDLRATVDESGNVYLEMSTEEGRTSSMAFSGKSALMKYLKEQGVERVKITDGTKKGFENPQEFEPPETIATIKGRDLHRVYFKGDERGRIWLCGEDLDGRELKYERLSSEDDFEKFKDRYFKEYGLNDSMLSTGEEDQKAIDKRIEEDKARAIRKAEFESKAIDFEGYKYADLSIKQYEGRPGRFYLEGYDEDGDIVHPIGSRSMSGLYKRLKDAGIDPETMPKDEVSTEEYGKFKKRIAEFESKAVDYDGKKYMDIQVFKDTDDTYQIIGYDEDGERKPLSSWYSDMYSICERLERATDGKVDPETIMQSDELKKEYHEYKKSMAEFESKAIQIGAEKFAGVSITSSGDDYILYGYDARGRKREIFKGDYRNVENVAKKVGKSASDFPMDEKTQKLRAFQIKEQEAIASGEYSDYDGHAYKDIRIEKSDYGEYRIRATDINGETRSLIVSGEEDEAIDALEKRGVTKYEFVDSEGKKIKSRPTDGMRKVRMLRKQDGTFEVFATTGKGKSGSVHSSTNESEARQWLRDNGIDDKEIKTKGMNPNDDVPRTHTCLSLESFDSHRMDREDHFSTLSHMSDKSKREVVDMMTDVFNQGTYRMRMQGHFEDVIDGHFKNLLETGTSRGSSDQDGRRRTGEKTFGHPYDIDAVEAEKYGYCAVSDDKEAYESDIAKWYGKTLYTFKKDSLKDRVTYSAGDTLDAGRPLAGYAGDKPTYEGVSALSRGTLREVLENYRSYKNGDIPFNEFHRRFSGACRDGYIECHYHGMLTIDDVESIIIPKSTLKDAFDNMSLEKRKHAIEKLQSKGIKLTIYSYGSYNDGYEYLRKEFSL